MGNSSALTTPEEQVEDLMREVADEHNLTLQMDVPNAPRGAVAAPPAALPQPQTTSEEDDLAARLEALKK